VSSGVFQQEADGNPAASFFLRGLGNPAAKPGWQVQRTFLTEVRLGFEKNWSIIPLIQQGADRDEYLLAVLTERRNHWLKVLSGTPTAKTTRELEPERHSPIQGNG